MDNPSAYVDAMRQLAQAMEDGRVDPPRVSAWLRVMSRPAPEVGQEAHELVGEGLEAETLARASGERRDRSGSSRIDPQILLGGFDLHDKDPTFKEGAAQLCEELARYMNAALAHKVAGGFVTGMVLFQFMGTGAVSWVDLEAFARTLPPPAHHALDT